MILIPNVLSALRLALAVWFPFAPRGFRPILLIAAALSDFVDGFIARRFKLTSWVGGLLDAVADKLFAVSALVTFTMGKELFWWQSAMLLARDIAVAVIALYAVTHRKWYAFRHMPARPMGKVTTASMFLLFLLLAFGVRSAVTWFAFGVAALLSLAAAADYLAAFSHARRPDRRGTLSSPANG